jgi:hypothetical protein
VQRDRSCFADGRIERQSAHLRSSLPVHRLDQVAVMKLPIGSALMSD